MKMFDSNHMQWMCIWICYQSVTTASVDQGFGFFQNTCCCLIDKLCQYAMVGAYISSKMIHTFTSATMKVFDSNHMQLRVRGKWIHQHSNITANVEQGLGYFSIILDYCLIKNHAYIKKTGHMSFWNETENHIRHNESVWQQSYAVDVHMDLSSLHYHCKCWPRFWVFPKLGLLLDWQTMPVCHGWGIHPIKND